jgi:hypothetical protein
MGDHKFHCSKKANRSGLLRYIGVQAGRRSRLASVTFNEVRQIRRFRLQLRMFFFVSNRIEPVPTRLESDDADDPVNYFRTGRYV